MLQIMTMFLQAAACRILYLALHLETGSFPRPLSPAEERQAFAALQAGDRTARDRLIRHNLRLVAHVAKKYYPASGNQEDYVSIGTIGLIKAVDSFDPARRVRFASYASQCIENAILSPNTFCPLIVTGNAMTVLDTKSFRMKHHQPALRIRSNLEGRLMTADEYKQQDMKAENRVFQLSICFYIYVAVRSQIIFSRLIHRMQGSPYTLSQF